MEGSQRNIDLQEELKVKLLKLSGIKISLSIPSKIVEHLIWGFRPHRLTRDAIYTYEVKWKKAPNSEKVNSVL